MIDLIEKRLLISQYILAIEPSKREAEDVLFEKMILNREPYAYVTPTKPPVIVTDMRTHRKFKGATSLMNESAYAHLAKICNGLPSNKLVVFLSGSPILNWQPVAGVRDSMLQDYRFRMAHLLLGTTNPIEIRKRIELGDLWNDHIEGRARLVRWIRDTLKPSCCVIFSGDVHHGSVVKGKATMRASKETQDLWSIDLVQITSSPMKNEPHDLSRTLLGLPLARLLDLAFPTNANVEISFTGDKGWMSISYDAVHLKGKLTKSPSWRPTSKKIPLKFDPTGTVIFRNHICVVDCSKQQQITANFFGSGMSCSGVVNI